MYYIINYTDVLCIYIIHALYLYIYIYILIIFFNVACIFLHCHNFLFLVACVFFTIYWFYGKLLETIWKPPMFEKLQIDNFPHNAASVDQPCRAL